jgi:hypothetical protein
MSDERISRASGSKHAVVNASRASLSVRAAARDTLISGDHGLRHSRRAMGDREDRGRVFLQLSEQQVDDIIQSVDSSELVSTHPSRQGLAGPAHEAGESTQWIFRPLMDDKSFSHSLLIGLEVLTCFPLDGTERGVAEVAEQLSMNNSTVHRYMSTLLRVGLLERNPDTRWYRVASARADGGRGQ